MDDASDGVRLRDGDWREAFERLDERGGGVVTVPAGRVESDPVTIDLAKYPNLRNNVSIRGAGIGTSTVDLGEGNGDGFSLVHSDEGDVFYLQLTGMLFEGARDGVLVRIGSDERTDAYNSCSFEFATCNGHPDATAACRLNAVLNTRHFGVHNCEGGTALELREFQFGGLTGSVSSRDGVSLELSGYTFANVVEWLNVEACDDGIRIVGENCDINRFGMLYGANVGGTLWRHEAPVQTRIDAAFVGENVERIADHDDGEYTVGLSNESFDDTGE
ncbi:hypothetical protein [Haloarcula amylovorans]|uniref:hypothetical protein n=1 Tax=Haloarcula amylovorans TaxID=2562280 RepID=UPI0010769687|nr:hypothetical protein [Halomicroarcula amylolytica]